MLDIIGKKHIFLGFSTLLLVVSIVAIVVFGFKEGIDFSGGTLWRFTILNETPSATELETLFRETLRVPDARITRDAGSGSFLARFSAIPEADHQSFVTELITAFPSFKELSFQSIGPSVGEALKNRSLIALALVLVGISLYIAFAFRKVFRPVSSWKYGWVTLITLFHDVAIPAGLLAILGHYGKVEVDSNFIIALLVVMGFSVHDTIVVFDRIRENLMLDRGKDKFGDVINRSVNQTMARSINTSLTLIFVLVALFVTGPAVLHYFILTLLVGVMTGIYSSIFVASPLLYLWHKGRKG